MTRLETAAAAHRLSRQLNEIQYTNGDGPSAGAAGRDPGVFRGAGGGTRWGQYPQLAVNHGMQSYLSLPLRRRAKPSAG